jgi:glutaredoxin
MLEYFHLYIMVDCPFCKDAIDLLEKEKKEFVITVMDKCLPFASGVKEEFNFKTVPVILKCSSKGAAEMIGGYTELKSFLLKESVAG